MFPNYFRSMRKALTSACTLLFVSMASAAVNPAAIKSDSLANVFIKDGKYEEALKMLNRTVSILDENNPDSLYIQTFVKMGYCYDRQSNPMKAIEMTKMAIFQLEAAGFAKNLYHANLYDNIALGYYKLEQYDQAQQWCDSAMNVARRFTPAGDAHVRFLNHQAMIHKAQKQLPEAVDYQKQVVALVEQLKGKYSEQHLEHLTTLRTLYDAQADSANYKKTSDCIRQLHDDIAQGVLPEATDLSTPKLCRQHNTDALLCCRWILGHYVTTEGMKDAVKFLSDFHKNTPDVAIYMGDAENEWAKKLNSVYLMAYIAASCDYSLRHPEALKYNFDQYKYAINKTLDYYEDNTKITGTIVTFEGYKRQRNYNPAKFEKTLKKNFKNFCDKMRAKRPFDFAVEAPTILQFTY